MSRQVENLFWWKKNFSEVNISTKTNISAQTLKKALHKNPKMQYLGTVIFLQYVYQPFANMYKISNACP